MTPEETSLARLLVALPGWRWVPGMASGTGRVYLGSGGVICWQGEGDRGGYIAAFDRCADLVGGLPDLHDPATAGTCGVVSRDTDGTDPKARATRAWARRWCDDETMRPLTGADGCPGFERPERCRRHGRPSRWIARLAE